MLGRERFVPWSLGKQIYRASQKPECFSFLQINNVNYLLPVTKCHVGCQRSCQSPRHGLSHRGLEERAMRILSRKESALACLPTQKWCYGSRHRGRLGGSFQSVGALGQRQLAASGQEAPGLEPQGRRPHPNTCLCGGSSSQLDLLPTLYSIAGFTLLSPGSTQCVTYETLNTPC